MEVSGRTKRQAAAYAAPAKGTADIVIDPNTRKFLESYPELQTFDVAEYMVTGMVFARRLLDFSGFQLHASAIALDGRAYLFSAFSGTGKSTHTEKWCRLFGAKYINDDKPALRLVDGVWMAYGTPWSGKHDISDPAGYPLGGIAFLERGENSICRLEPAQALPLIMGQTTRHLWQEGMDQKLELLDRLLRQVPVWKLTCRNDDEAARTSMQAMTSIYVQ
jgi:hypothetical protein